MDVRPHPDGLGGFVVAAPEYDAEFTVGGACPVQAFGTVRGRDLFFHARHGVWFCEVADHNGDLPSDGYRDNDGSYCEGVDPDNGYMPYAEAVRLIELCLREYTAGIDD